jgi:antibiotic biosynthesis monooxygenase (ABM) superfamily enzyme
MPTFPGNSTPSASFFVEHIVPRGRGMAFRLWHANLTRAARRFEGYIRTDLCPPVEPEPRQWFKFFKAGTPDQLLKWYSIIHFDSPEHLSRWLQSNEREAIIAAGQRIFESYQFKSFSTGLEGWFSRKTGSEQMGLGTPAWKQNLAVILGLYPTVMIQSQLFAAFGIMQHWPLASSMLVNNIITSSLLTWVVMPFVAQSMSFWLQPAHQALSVKSHTFGMLIIVTILGFMMVIFNWL